MDGGPQEFVHVLLFACPECAGPIVATERASERNLEEVDESSFPCRCFCGWNGTVGGLRARRHWVEPWVERGENDNI